MSKAIRVNFNANYQLHKVCAEDDLRPAMANILFLNGYAYASDAHIAVKAKISDISFLSDEAIEKLNGYFIHKDAFKKLLKYDEIEVKDNGLIEIIDNGHVVTIKLCKNGKDGCTMPDFEKAIFGKEVKSCENTAIGFNAVLLDKLRSALGGSKRCEFHFTGKETFIEVEMLDEREYGIDIRGIIMPILIEK